MIPNQNTPVNTPSSLGDAFDRAFNSLNGLPDVVRTEPATLPIVAPFTQTVVTYIVQTLRQTGEGDTVFVQCIGATGAMRIVLPPDVADVIARQRGSVVTKNRRKGARQAVQTRAERGIMPGFLKKRGK